MFKCCMSFCLMALLASCLMGCGSNEFQVAAATGKVTCSGQPVGSGSVTFTPVGKAGALETGKPATGTLKADGTFTLSTYDRFDGAIVGQHTVQYTGSEGEEAEAEETGDEGKPAAKKAAKRAASCVQTAKIVVEVKAGSKNDFAIELIGSAK